MQPWLYYLVATCNIAPGVPVVEWENLFNPFIGTAVADYYNVLTVPYPASTLDAGESLNEGINNLVAQIESSPEPFILGGASQGATVISSVLKYHMQSGDLSARLPDMWQAFTFGNPCREAGHTYPGGTDPGGHGIRLPEFRLVGTPVNWWDFAAPGDIIATNGDDSIAQLATAVFEWYYVTGTNPLGPTASEAEVLAASTAALQGLVSLSSYTSDQIAQMVHSVWQASTWIVPHTSYTYASFGGTGKTAVQLAVDQAVALAQAHGMVAPELRTDNVVSGPGPGFYIVELFGVVGTLKNELTEDPRWGVIANLVGTISAEWTSNPSKARDDANSLVTLAEVMKASYPANGTVDIMLRYAQALAGIWESDILNEE